MDARVQRRVQRYGWDLAASDDEPLWQAQLAPAREALLACAALRPGEAVLDVACGAGLVSFCAAESVGPAGRVVGVDLSGGMIEPAAHAAAPRGVRHATFARMDVEALTLPEASFDVVRARSAPCTCPTPTPRCARCAAC